MGFVGFCLLFFFLELKAHRMWGGAWGEVGAGRNWEPILWEAGCMKGPCIHALPVSMPFVL